MEKNGNINRKTVNFLGYTITNNTYKINQKTNQIDAIKKTTF